MNLDVLALTKQFVAQPSITGEADGENRMAEAIAEQLERINLRPGFWETGDGRKSVWTLHRNSASKLVWLFTSHFDTVGVGDYARIPGGDPFRPETLVEAFASGRYGQEVAEDARSGDYLFGRGSLDMKSGIAAQIAALGAKPRANVLFVSCPDEESASVGILTALPKVLELVQAEGLEILGVANSDYTAPRFTGDTARYLYLGTVGKLLPLFLIGGIETHVGEPYRGIGAAAIAAEIVSLLELNPELCDRVGSEVSEPPVTLRLRDLKSHYDVQTPFEAYLYANLLTYEKGPGEALAALRTLAQSAVHRLLERHTASWAKHGECERKEVPKELVPRVLLYEELPVEAREAAIREVECRLTGREDPQEISLEVARAAVDLSRIQWPFVLLLLAPPFYPHVYVRAEAFRQKMLQIAAKFGLVVRDFYPYISDISYIGGAARAEHAITLAANLPQWNAPQIGYTVPEIGLSGLGCPIANLGPWGKDAHGVTERVYTRSVPVVVEALRATVESWDPGSD